MSKQSRPIYSLVVPIYNEEAVLPLLLHRLDRLLEALDGPAEVIFVDDGSRDCSPIVLAARARDNPSYRYIRLSRNFGHQVAITAGMDRASGDAVIVMDADLQDPPELVLEMVAKWREGYEIVYAQRLSREGEGRFKKATADLFYRLLDRLASVEIPRNVGDFRLIDRKVLAAFSTMREKDRFVRGMFAWMGFKQTAVTFHRQPRAAGETKYPLRKMLRLAANGIVSFSDAPLRLALWVGMAVSALAMLYAACVVVMWFTQAHLVPGWSSTVVITALLSGINMMMTGIMGLYVGRIHNEVKGRPLYLVDQRVGFEDGAEAMAADRRARSAS
ncbi:glycosyltransferase family 2 protein [Labrys wisconsinensis]|uniref:Dolichol-phosphate mannosyltransferase n=1 Tax=Labrys wisconsinensis TaxID=425677 RepID=A0ABU0JD46_9HYPH|nr:glycosyltransferase family 2 protein [Labrys wisconsinensis]MDQ0471179.1 dolichol-phosphate mannosyltransferase [Labrys wisconsinensis]